jgi:putative effector of murein hydrolase
VLLCVLLPMAAGAALQAMLDINMINLAQQVLTKVLQHCKQCWIRSPFGLRTNVIIMDFVIIIITYTSMKNQCFVFSILLPSSVLLDIQIYLNIQQVLKKVLIITFVRAAADAAGNKFRPNGPF